MNTVEWLELALCHAAGTPLAWSVEMVYWVIVQYGRENGQSAHVTCTA